MKPAIQHVLVTVSILVATVLLVLTSIAVLGLYNFGADARHTLIVYSLIEYMRERSIKVRAAKISVPELSSARRVIRGAGNYDAMCAQCHLAPGMAETELSRGLYPEPPNLSKVRIAPAEAFWAIKHGVKASGMPAWGKSMSDEEIWNLVAFIQGLPERDAAQYRRIVASSSGHAHEGAGASSGRRPPEVPFHPADEHPHQGEHNGDQDGHGNRKDGQ